MTGNVSVSSVSCGQFYLDLSECCLTIITWVAQDRVNVLVGRVLAQSAHDVSHLVEGHLAVTNSVKETESLLEVWRRQENQERTFQLQSRDTSRF